MIYLLKQILVLSLFAFIVCFIGYFFYNSKIDKLEDCKNKKALYSDIFFLICLSMATIAFMPAFPLSNKLPEIDSAVFIHIGNQMHNGLVPYKDMFDHKGVLLYFIEYIATFTSNSSLGLYLIEVANLIFTALVFYKTVKLVTNSRIVCYVTLISVIFTQGLLTYSGGNMTEEYALPWIALAFYIFIKFFKTNQYKFADIILLGIGFSVVTLLRVNMVAIWGIFIPAVLIKLIIDKRGKDIGKCIGGFLIGIIIVCLPTLIYLLLTNSLQAMIDCYINFNLSYTSSKGNIISMLKVCLYFVIALLPTAIAYIFAAFSKKKDSSYYCSLIFYIISLLAISISGRTYQHYSITLLPTSIIPTALSVSLFYELLNKKLVNKKYQLKPLLTVILSIILVGVSFVFNGVIQPARINNDKEYKIVEYITENSNEDDDVLILCNDIKYYDLAKRNTKNRYFYQQPPISVNDEIFYDFMNELKENKPDLIVGTATKENDIKIFNEALPEVLEYLDSLCEKGVYRLEQTSYSYAYIKN